MTFVAAVGIFKEYAFKIYDQAIMINLIHVNLLRYNQAEYDNRRQHRKNPQKNRMNIRYFHNTIVFAVLLYSGYALNSTAEPLTH